MYPAPTDEARRDWHVQRHTTPKAVPNGPQGIAFWWGLDRFRRHPLAYLEELAQRYGNISLLPVPGRPLYFINHPDLVQHVLQSPNYVRGVGPDDLFARFLGHNRGQNKGLLINDGPSWLRQRRLMQPAFHQQSIARLGTQMTEATLALADHWKAADSQGVLLDVAADMTRLTLRIVCAALFGADLSQHEVDQLSASFAVIVQGLAAASFHPLARLAYWPGVPSWQQRRFWQANGHLDAVVYRIIKERRDQPADRGDLLSLLLAACDEETSAGMDDQQLRDEVLTLIFAGHETTAVALSWIWYVLSTHPAVLNRLHTELDNVLGGRVPTIPDLPSLPFGLMVVEETMRLYPPAWMFSRTTLTEDKLGDYLLPKGGVVLMSPYTLHRHPAFWNRPEVFEPERFTPEQAKGRPRYAYFPFAGGAHQCIGNQFALIEAQLVLATLAQQFQLHLVPGQYVEPEPLITLHIRHGLRMRIERR